jgi:hypothetical protein
VTRTKGPRKPHALLDALLKDQQLRNDSHLADVMGYSKGRICEIRSGKPVSAEFRCAIQRKFRWSLRRIDDLAPPDNHPIKEPA